MTALHADDADRARHIGGDHGNDALRGGQCINTEPGGNAVDRSPRKIRSDGHAAAQ